MSTYHEVQAIEILTSIKYAALATAAEDQPWNSPVFVAFGRTGEMFWTSSPGAQHSQNIAANGNVFITLFDSTVAAGEGEGLYIKAIARQLTSDEDIATARHLLNDRAQPNSFESDAYYVALPSDIWMNDIETNEDGNYVRDKRVSLPLSLLEN